VWAIPNVVEITVLKSRCILVSSQGSGTTANTRDGNRTSLVFDPFLASVHSESCVPPRVVWALIPRRNTFVPQASNRGRRFAGTGRRQVVPTTRSASYLYQTPVRLAVIQIEDKLARDRQNVLACGVTSAQRRRNRAALDWIRAGPPDHQASREPVSVHLLQKSRVTR